MRPRPARRMTGATARHAHAVPFRFSSIMYSQSASACSRAGARFAVPAQLTRMSTVPWRATTVSTIRSTSAFFATSAASVVTSPSRAGPAGLADADRLTATTRAPAAARWPDDRLADALGAAGDDGDAAGEIEQVLRGRPCAHWAILASR